MFAFKIFFLLMLTVVVINACAPNLNLQNRLSLLHRQGSNAVSKGKDEIGGMEIKIEKINQNMDSNVQTIVRDRNNGSIGAKIVVQDKDTTSQTTPAPRNTPQIPTTPDSTPSIPRSKQSTLQTTEVDIDLDIDQPDGTTSLDAKLTKTIPQFNETASQTTQDPIEIDQIDRATTTEPIPQINETTFQTTQVPIDTDQIDSTTATTSRTTQAPIEIDQIDELPTTEVNLTKSISQINETLSQTIPAGIKIEEEDKTTTQAATKTAIIEPIVQINGTAFQTKQAATNATNAANATSAGTTATTTRVKISRATPGTAKEPIKID